MGGGHKASVNANTLFFPLHFYSEIESKLTSIPTRMCRALQTKINIFTKIFLCDDELVSDGDEVIKLKMASFPHYNSPCLVLLASLKRLSQAPRLILH